MSWYQEDVNVLTTLGRAVQSTAKRVTAIAKVGATSGFMHAVTMPGAKAALAVLRSGSQNPSAIYRVHAKNSPDRAAVICGDVKLTFAELDARIDRLAHGLAAAGFGRGRGLVLMMKNSIEFIELTAACARIGASAIAVSWRTKPDELIYLANDSGAAGIACDADLLPVVQGAAPQLSAELMKRVYVVGDTLTKLYAETTAPFAQPKKDDDEAAVVIYTSGTTGKPKGAVRKFPRDAMSAALRFIGATPMRYDDVHLVACPLYHTTAFGFLSLSHLIGSTIVVMPEFKPDAFLQLVEKHRVTTAAMVPTMLHRVLELGREAIERNDARSLRIVFTTGAALPTPVANAFMDQFGDIIHNVYGATETGTVTLALPRDLRSAPGTIGRAVPGIGIRLYDDGGNLARSGELFAKSDLLVAGYHNDERATASSMRDGYFSVGDIARVDDVGRYFIEGRKRDMIISGGVNVYPAEVESVLESHPSVAEVAIVGVEDKDFGERVRAFIALKPGAKLTDKELIAWAKEKLSGAKVPRDIVFMDALPRNPTGKVLKKELRAHSS